MPNWCSNSISIYNPEVFKEKCVKGEGFSFDNIIPQPEHMRAYNNLDIDHLIKKTIEEENITRDTITNAEHISNEFFVEKVLDYLYAKPWMDAEAERTGIQPDDWYSWDCENWGTKWDLSTDDFDLNDLDDAIKLQMPYDFIFDTAWAPPIPVLEKMAELGVNFSWSCEESGCQIYMSGEASDGVFSYGDDEPPQYDEDGNRIDEDEE